MIQNVDEIWRLYRREWVTVHTTDTIVAIDGRGVHASACAWTEANLKDRVHDRDIKVEVHTDLAHRFWAHVQVFKENLKGEFKIRGQADKFASMNNYDEYTVVPRNSPADHEIRNYGVTKL